MKHFLRKKLFSGALLFLCVAMLGGGIVVYAQNSLTIDKDIILSPGKVIRFPDSSTLNSASAIGGGGWTATSTKIYPEAATFVGIGTTNPTSPLYVVGTTTIAGVLQVGAGGGLGEAATSTIIYRSQFVDSDNTAYYLDPAATGNSAIFAGKVGIGVVSPVAKLQIAGEIQLADGYNLQWGNSNAIAASNGNYIGFYAGSAAYTERMRISNSGNVSIGTTTSNYKLSVSGDINTVNATDAIRMTGNRVLYRDGVAVYMGDIDAGGIPVKIRANGADAITILTGGNVGIGLTNPTYKFQVTGQIYADEGTAAADIIANKIDGVTFDPVYTIEGKRYATYMPGMVGGVKEEMTGIADLQQGEKAYSYTIDLNSEEKGSDEWLFAHTIDLEKNGLKHVTVLLTPNFDGKVWYEKDSVNNKIVIYGVTNDSQPTTYNSKKENTNNIEVSYRLTAPRFDSKDWTNYSSSEWEGLNFDTYYKKAN